MHLGSHIVAKLILLSLLSISVTGRITDLFPREGPGIRGSKEDARLKKIFRSFFLQPEYKNKGSKALRPKPEEKLFDPKAFTEDISSQIAKTWSEKRDQVLSIDDDFSRVFSLMLTTRTVKYQFSLLLQSSPTNQLVKRRMEVLYQARRGLNTIVKKLFAFEQWQFVKLLQHNLPVTSNQILAHILKGHHPSKLVEKELPNELFEHITDLAWKSRGQSVVDDLKQLIHDHHLFSELPSSQHYLVESALQQLWKGALETVDVLYMHHFVEQPIIQSFFQSIDNIKQLVIQADVVITYVAGYSPIHTAGNLLTKHWYWPHVHKFIEALDSEQQTLIDGCCFLVLRHDKMIAPDYDDVDVAASTLYSPFYSTFRSEQYLRFLTMLKEQPNDDLQAFADEHAQQIIDFLSTHISGHQLLLFDKEIVQHLCYILEFLEPYTSPDKQVAVRGLRNEIQFYRLDDKVQGWKSQAATFGWWFVEKQSNQRSPTSSSLKAEFQQHLNEAKGFLAQLKSKAKDFLQQLNSFRGTENTPQVIDLTSTMEELVKQKEDLVKQMEDLVKQMEDLVKQMESDCKKFFPDKVDNPPSLTLH